MLLRRISILSALAVVGIAMLTKIDLTAAEEQRSHARAPQVVSLNLRPNYYQDGFDVQLQALSFVPANSRVTTKIYSNARPAWVAGPSYGPYTSGRTVTYAWHHVNIGARAWVGKTLTATMSASSNEGVDSKTASVLIERPARR